MASQEESEPLNNPPADKEPTDGEIYATVRYVVMQMEQKKIPEF